MKLLSISDNVQVNVDKLDSIRMDRSEDGDVSISTVINGVAYKVDAQYISSFLSTINLVERGETKMKQYTAV